MASFSYTNSADNQFEYVTVEYGGGRECNGFETEANICLYPKDVMVSIKNSTLRQSNGYGLYIAHNVTLTAFSNNVITENESGAAYVGAVAVGMLDDTTTFSGNSNDYVIVIGMNVSTDQTWPAIDVPYLMNGETELYAQVTISAGATLVFSQFAGLKIQGDDGALTAIDTEQNPILFTGEQKTSGLWDGIFFVGTGNNNNRFEYVTVEYGGGRACNGADTGSNICLHPGNVSFDMTDSLIQHSAHCGVYVGDDSTVNPDIADVNDFVGNPSSVCYEN